MAGRAVRELLGVAVEHPGLDELEVEVVAAGEDRVDAGSDSYGWAGFVVV